MLIAQYIRQYRIDSFWGPESGGFFFGHLSDLCNQSLTGYDSLPALDFFSRALKHYKIVEGK